MLRTLQPSMYVGKRKPPLDMGQLSLRATSSLPHYIMHRNRPHQGRIVHLYLDLGEVGVRL